MSKTTTIKITTRIITTHLPFFDTTRTIKSCPLLFGETSVYFGELRGVEVPHRERLGAGAEQQQNRRSLTLRTALIVAPCASTWTRSKHSNILSPPQGEHLRTE